MNLKAVIFDLFGTLVGDFPSSAREMTKEIALALAVPCEQFIPLWTQTTEMRVTGAFDTVEASIEYVCGVMGAGLEVEQIKRAVEIRLKYTRQALQPRPNAIDTLSQLKNRGYRIGLISNCSIEIPILWPETEFAALIESPIFSSKERLRKPDPSIYRRACDHLGVLPEQCVYIADGENHELTAAAEVGLHPVLIRNSIAQNRLELFREAREWQGVTIASLPEVLQLVRR
jgi:putative hydrolase of the HAD superfamily